MKCGGQCTGDHLVKRVTADDDDGLPLDTTALVLTDVATGRAAVYPKAAKSKEYTIKAMPFRDPSSVVAPKSLEPSRKTYCA